MATTMHRSAKLSVSARAATPALTGKRTVAIRQKTSKTGPGKSAPQPKRETSNSSGTSLAILARVQELRLLSKVEKLGLLSKLEASGLTLSKIEESGLLSLAENSGVLNLVADKKTPGLLNLAGVGLLTAAAAIVVLVPDETTVQVVSQVLGVTLLGAAGVAALFAGSTLESFQKL